MANIVLLIFCFVLGIILVGDGGPELSRRGCSKMPTLRGWPKNGIKDATSSRVAAVRTLSNI
jgi:hypothetical protein